MCGGVRRYPLLLCGDEDASSFRIGPRCSDCHKKGIMQARYCWPTVDRETTFVINAVLLLSLSRLCHKLDTSNMHVHPKSPIRDVHVFVLLSHVSRVT